MPIICRGAALFISALILCFGGSALGAGGEFQLKNGVTVVYEYIPQTQVTSVQAWIKTGSVNEDNSTNGISHFLEHILFKGTKNFKPDEIDTVVESRGGIMNAGTSKDYTTYYITLPSEYAETAFKVIADMVFNASFIPDEIEKEKPVVVQEIQRKFDNPTYDMWHDAIAALFKGTPYEREVIGTPENINSFTREMLLKYYWSHYHPLNTTLVIVGDISREEAEKLSVKYFSIPAKAEAEKGYDKPWRPFMEKTAKKEYRRDVSQDYVLIAYQVDAVAKDAPVYEVLTEILSGGEYSFLNRELKYNRGLVTVVSSGELLNKNAGAYMFHMITNPGDASSAIEALNVLLAGFASGELPAGELQKAKNRIKGRLIFQKEKASSQASEIGHAYTLDLQEYYHTYLKRIDAVSAEDVVNTLKAALKSPELVYLTVPQSPASGQ